MPENLRQPTATLKPSTPTNSPTIRQQIAGNRTLISLISAAIIATGCGGNAFESEANAYDAGADQQLDSSPDTDQDAPLDTEPDAPADSKQDTAEDAPQETDSGCQGTEITLTNMPGYEVFHAGLNCNPVYLDTTQGNTTLETEDRTLCVEDHDELVIVTYYQDGNIHNDLTGTSTTPFNPGLVKRGGIDMEKQTPDGYFMLTQCIQRVEHGLCTPVNVTDTNSDPYKFRYPGDQNCIGTTNPPDTGSVFYMSK